MNKRFPSSFSSPPLCDCCGGGCHLSSWVVAPPFSIFSLLAFCIFCFYFIVPHVGFFFFFFRLSPLYVFSPTLWVFCFPFVNVLVFTCGYFYFNDLTNNKDVQIYFECRFNAFFKLQYISYWSSMWKCLNINSLRQRVKP